MGKKIIKRKSFQSEQIELIRRDCQGNRIFHSKGKYERVMRDYKTKFDGDFLIWDKKKKKKVL